MADLNELGISKQRWQRLWTDRNLRLIVEEIEVTPRFVLIFLSHDTLFTYRVGKIPYRNGDTFKSGLPAHDRNYIPHAPTGAKESCKKEPESRDGLQLETTESGSWKAAFPRQERVRRASRSSTREG